MLSNEYQLKNCGVLALWTKVVLEGLKDLSALIGDL